MWIAVNSQGQAVYRTPYQTLNNARWWPPEDQALICVLGALGGAAEDYRLHLVQDDAQARILGEAPLEALRPIIEDGQVVRVEVDAPGGPIPIYAHISITGGDGDTPPGVELGSGDLLNITAEVRSTADPASPLISPLSGEWRITIRNQAGGPPDIVQVLVEGGQVVKRADHTPGVVYDPPEVIGIYAVSEDDFTPLALGGQTYLLKLADPDKARFKVYRKL